MIYRPVSRPKLVILEALCCSVRPVQALPARHSFFSSAFTSSASPTLLYRHRLIKGLRRSIYNDVHGPMATARWLSSSLVSGLRSLSGNGVFPSGCCAGYSPTGSSCSHYADLARSIPLRRLECSTSCLISNSLAPSKPSTSLASASLVRVKARVSGLRGWGSVSLRKLPQDPVVLRLSFIGGYTDSFKSVG